MSRIQVGDTVAFRRQVVMQCGAEVIASFRAVVTEIAGDWLFMTAQSGCKKVMRAADMCKVARNGVVLEVV